MKMNNYKKLYRSRTNKMLAGVCGGVAEYFNVDPTLIRLLAIFVPGFGLIGYIAGALVIPEQP